MNGRKERRGEVRGEEGREENKQGRKHHAARGVASPVPPATWSIDGRPVSASTWLAGDF